MSEANNIVSIAGARRAYRQYSAKGFHVIIGKNRWQASGTLCGHIDFVVPESGTYCLSPDEIEAIIIMLKQARHDVLENSDPQGDLRLYEPET